MRWLSNCTRSNCMYFSWSPWHTINLDIHDSNKKLVQILRKLPTTFKQLSLTTGKLISNVYRIKFCITTTANLHIMVVFETRKIYQFKVDYKCNQ